MGQGSIRGSRKEVSIKCYPRMSTLVFNADSDLAVYVTDGLQNRSQHVDGKLRTGNNNSCRGWDKTKRDVCILRLFFHLKSRDVLVCLLDKYP